MPKDPGDFLDDRQSQAQPSILIRALHIAALELLEDLFKTVFGNADAAVPDLDGQALAVPATAQHHPPAGGIANGIAQQIAQDPRQQLHVAAHQGRTRHKVQFQPLTARHLDVFGGQVVEQLAEGERRDIGLDHPGIKLGNVHQRAQQVFHVLQRVADVAHQLRVRYRLTALEQSAGEQPRGVERLQQVMTDRREEFGFRQVGLLGLALGLAQAQLHPAALVDFAQ